MDIDTLVRQNEDIMKQNQIIMDSAAALVNAVSVKLKTENDLLDLVKNLNKEVIGLKTAISGATKSTESNSNTGIEKLIDKLEKMAEGLETGFSGLLLEIQRKK